MITEIIKEFEWIYKTIDIDKSGSYKDEIKYKKDLKLILLVCFMLSINLLFIFQYVIDKNIIGIFVQLIYLIGSYYIFKSVTLAIEKVVYNGYYDRTNNNYYNYSEYIRQLARI